MFVLALLAPALAQPTASSRYPDLQVAVHGGLLQPLLLNGFNAAVDVRIKRFIFSYSHGEGLDLTGVAGLPPEQEELGVRVRMPYTTGFGVGVSLIDELYVMADFKVHGFEVDTGLDPARYTTITLGGEVGYRLFVWEGLFVSPVVRYWPNVWTSAPGGFALQTSAGSFQHDPMSQGAGGLFANVLIGWAFDMKGKRRTTTLIRPRTR